MSTVPQVIFVESSMAASFVDYHCDLHIMCDKGILMSTSSWKKCVEIPTFPSQDFIPDLHHENTVVPPLWCVVWTILPFSSHHYQHNHSSIVIVDGSASGPYGSALVGFMAPLLAALMYTHTHTQSRRNKIVEIDIPSFSTYESHNTGYKTRNREPLIWHKVIRHWKFSTHKNL